MPSLLTIPREIRDEIYKWGLLDSLASSKSRALQRDRKRVAYNDADPETHYGEESVRYPEHTSLPPTYPLLQTSRQLRAELLERIQNMGKLKYKIDLTNRDDKDTLYPTWISVPAFATRVDLVEVELRVRSRKTSSVWTIIEGEGREQEGDVFFGGLVLLQRFLERGVYFLSKKKAQKISIGLLAIYVDRPDYVTDEDATREVDEFAEFLDDWMRGVTVLGQLEDAKEREDRQFRFLAGKVERVSLSAKKNLRREWDMREMLEKRDEEERLRMVEAPT